VGVILDDPRPYLFSHAYRSLGIRPRTFPTIPDRVETPSLTITRRIKDFTACVCAKVPSGIALVDHPPNGVRSARYVRVRG
jgi:hypothetical protein